MSRPLIEYEDSEIARLFHYTEQFPRDTHDFLIDGARKALDDEETCRALGINYNEIEGTGWKRVIDWKKAVLYTISLMVEEDNSRYKIPEELRKALE